jgi:RHS repeat-associated protein
LRHDPVGRVREHIDPDGSRRAIDHDVSGRPRRVTAVRGPDQVTITVERDELARPVRIAEAGADGMERGAIELRWDRGGRLVERRRAGRVVGWSYDADGLPAAVRNPDGTTTAYRRDGVGRVNDIGHPRLGSIALQRDPDGRLLGVRDPRVVARLGYSEGWLTSYDVTVDGCHRATRLTRDGAGRVVAADLDGRPVSYGYDTAGQLCSAVDATGEYRFDYDAAGRLVTETRADGTRHHRHDAAGQLEVVVGPDGEHRVAHDACGRRVADDTPGGSRRYAWDPLGRLTGITTGGGRSRRVVVDALGGLAGVDDVGVDHDAVDPLGPLLALGDSTLIGHGHPWAQAGEWGAAPFVPDWQQTPAGRRGDPWGAVTDWDMTIGYRGELTVDGLVWLRNRVYDPVTRAFLAPDPLPPVPGTAYAANPYHYAGNDPVNAVDPLGLRPLTDADLAAARFAGGPPGALLAGGVGALALGGPGTDPYRGLSPVNGLLQAGDVAGGLYGAKLEVDGHFGRLTGEYDRALADRYLTQLRQQGRVVNPAQFYDDLDHFTALGRQGDDLIANAGRLERAAKFTPPKIGGGLALAGIGYDIATGKDPVQAVAAGGGGFAASVLAGAAIGSFIPVPGVGTAVGALGGAVVGTFTSGAIDSLFENGLDPGKALDRGVEAVADTGKAIGGGVMKVAKGIGGLFD